MDVTQDQLQEHDRKSKSSSKAKRPSTWHVLEYLLLELLHLAAAPGLDLAAVVDAEERIEEQHHRGLPRDLLQDEQQGIYFRK